MNDDLLPPVRNKDLERISGILSLNCYMTIFLCIFSSILVITALILPGVIPVEKKAFILLVGVAVLLAGIVLICARRDPSILAIFTTLCAFLGGTLLGVGATLLAPQLVNK
jgi:hypothetical protein